MKITDKIKRQTYKHYSRVLKKLIELHGVNLYIKDSQNFISKIYPEDDIFHLITTKNHLDGAVVNLIQDLSKQELNTCIDVGANLGFVSAILSLHSKKVFSFEPEPKNIERFKDLLEKNSIRNIEIVEKAVADKSGKLRFYTSPHAHAHHSLGLAHAGQSENNYIEVETITLDKFCNQNNIHEIDCLKVDVEGFEHEVFLGAEELLKNKRIKNIIFEISHGVMNNLKKDPKKIFDLLLQYEYTIYTSTHKKVSIDKISDFTGQDLIAKA